MEATCISGGEVGSRHPMIMGTHSGKAGTKGRRIQKPPSFFPTRAPSRRDLGLPERVVSVDPPGKLPLHLKDVTTIDLLTLQSITTGELAGQLELARRWLDDEQLYNVTWAPLSAAQVPVMRFSLEEVQQMVHFGTASSHLSMGRSVRRVLALDTWKKRKAE